MNSKVDASIDGSDGRPDEVRALRKILLGCNLTEEITWGTPCYAHDGTNIAIVQEMKGSLPSRSSRVR